MHGHSHTGTVRTVLLLSPLPLVWLIPLLEIDVLRVLWPVVVALAIVVLTRHALWGLLLGAFSGTVILHDGNPWQAYLALFADHLAPSLSSNWKLGSVAFTLILGGFAAILEAGGGFQAILHLLVRGTGDSSRRFQWSSMGLGLICFFDGLANSMMVGRVGKSLAPRCGVSRVKLAYIVDSTSSAVACVAFISTWIAYQLSMIKESYQLAGMADVNAYAVFMRSVPYNFYCWFTLVMLTVSIARRFNPGPMGALEDAALACRRAPERVSMTDSGGHRPSARHASTVLIPLATLVTAFLSGFYLLGCPGELWPITVPKVVAAFGSDAGPLVMVLAGLMASVVAALLFPGAPARRIGRAGRAFGNGLAALINPVFILVAAWMISSVLGELKTAEVLAKGLRAGAPVACLPGLIFATGALISFSCGTSWGTMGILFPLAIPVVAAATTGLAVDIQERLLHCAVAAVFSGAVFGDHCSPFSDTTIVSSISSGVEPHDHIVTQLPFALWTALGALVLGFLPAGLGLPAGLSLLAGVVFFVALPSLRLGPVHLRRPRRRDGGGDAARE